MDEQTELRQAMSVVRSRGLANADVLAKRVERLSDWREHVRAHPLPIALAAAALGYWLVPIRPRQLPPPPTGTGTATGQALPVSAQRKVAAKLSQRRRRLIRPD